MGAKPQSVMRMRAFYYDESKGSDLLVCGQWEYQQAQRKFGKSLKEAGEQGDLEYMAFVGYRAAIRQGLIESSVSFDDWAAGVMALEQDESQKDEAKDQTAAGESPAPLDE